VVAGGEDLVQAVREDAVLRVLGELVAGPAKGVRATYLRPSADLADVRRTGTPSAPNLSSSDGPSYSSGSVPAARRRGRPAPWPGVRRRSAGEVLERVLAVAVAGPLGETAAGGARGLAAESDARDATDDRGNARVRAARACLVTCRGDREREQPCALPESDAAEMITVVAAACLADVLGAGAATEIVDLVEGWRGRPAAR